MSNKPKAKMSRKKKMLIFICIFMSFVLIFGIGLGVTIAVRNARSYASYAGVRLYEGEASFFSAYYKYNFLISNAHRGAKDTPEFWNSKYEGEKTYLDLLREGTEEYLRQIVIKNYLFDSYLDLTFYDELHIEDALEEILTYKADGSEETFDEIYSQMGFDFDDFKSSAVMLYKANVVADRIYGENGANMQKFPDECAEFFETYSHVKLLFLRTEDKFDLDSEGNRITDENGNDVLVDFSEAEKQQRDALIAEIRASIAAFEEKTDDLRMTPEYFSLLLSQYGDGDPNANSSGYYFSVHSEFTAQFASANEKLEDIVKHSLTMKNDSYAELPYSGGVCFIYKYANTSGAYTDTSEDGFFADFYALAAEEAFADVLSELVGEVDIDGKLSKIDLATLPTKKMFIPEF